MFVRAWARTEGGVKVCEEAWSRQQEDVVARLEERLNWVGTIGWESGDSMAG